MGGKAMSVGGLLGHLIPRLPPILVTGTERRGSHPKLQAAATGRLYVRRRWSPAVARHKWARRRSLVIAGDGTARLEDREIRDLKSFDAHTRDERAVAGLLFYKELDYLVDLAHLVSLDFFDRPELTRTSRRMSPRSYGYEERFFRSGNGLGPEGGLM
jgi:hypothetical protein